MGMQNAQDFMDHCLFHGLMPEQDPTAADAQDIGEIGSELPSVTYANAHQKLEKVKSYNPCSAKVVLGFDFGKIWSEKLLKQV